VEAVYRDEKETFAAKPNENLRLRLTGGDEADIQAGFVLSSIKNPVPVVTTFEAQMQVGGGGARGAGARLCA
jgi:peptide chain release factor subunit 3